jgi:uncharacterized repeat protein (TIGR03803 family)
MRAIRTVGIALPLACCLAAIAATPTQVTFRVIYDSPQYGSPVWIAQLSPEVLLWDTRDFILSISPRGGAVTQVAAVPSGCSTCALTYPMTAANERDYAFVLGNSNNPTYPFSFDLKPSSVVNYPPQAFTDMFVLSLPDGQLLGIGGDGTGGYYLVLCDLEGNTTPINYQFPAGEASGAGPIYGSDGNYYGISVPVGQPGYLYRLTPPGSFTKVLTLPYNSSLPLSLVQATDGNLYGFTQGGGANGYGAFYQVTMAGQFTLLYSFTDKNTGPANLLQASDGNFYGITNAYSNPPSGGEIFQLTKSGQYAPIYKVNGPDGQSWFTRLIQGSDGLIYGTATAGGPSSFGTIFSLDMGLPKPVPQALSFSPTSGATGAKIRIWGYNLLEGSVQFNGVAATTAYNSGPNYVWAAVPAGAATGPITVTTPGGASTTVASFTVK